MDNTKQTVTIMLIALVVLKLLFTWFKKKKLDNSRSNLLISEPLFEVFLWQFQNLSRRTQTTFMHRFCDSLDEDQLMLMRKYLDNHFNLLIKNAK